MTNPPYRAPGLSGALVLLSLAFASVVRAEDPPLTAEAAATIGNNAWMLTSTALVLFMTLPGLALFYGGLVSKKNVLSVLMHCFALACVLSLVWLVCGYSLSIGEKGGWTGGFGHLMHRGVAAEGILTSAFQMTFFIITPALMVGTFVERIKFPAMLLFSVLWALLVYAPICHITWFGGGEENVSLFTRWGVIDLAGGIVVHITAGVGALVACVMVGKRNHPAPPHNLPMTVTGTAMLWVGWFGFNAGSAFGSSGGRAGMAMLVTQIAAAAAVLSWLTAEWIGKGKPSVLGAISGAVAGLVAITPAAGFVLPGSALIIGLVAGVAGYWGATALKHALKYDDSLDAFGVHGICGIVGALLVGFLAYGPLSATTALPEGSSGGMEQFIKQVIAVAATMAYTAVATWILLKITDVIVGLRVTEEEEREGLDVALHGERIN